MEDYHGAFGIRFEDVRALLSVQPPRCVAAAHLGGAAIECRLKGMLRKYHRINEWNEVGARPKDPLLRQAISNPGHGLVAALKSMSELYKRAKADQNLLQHLARVLYPLGSTTQDFISMRYSSSALTAVELASWRRSFDYVLGWLKKNEGII